MTDQADDDVAKLAAQIATVARAPGEQRGQLEALAGSVAALGRALSASEGDATARKGAADELDRVRKQLLAMPSLPETRGLTQTIELVAGWLRAPTPENTAAVERLVAALRNVPGGQQMWGDQTAEAKRKAELDADVQKSLDEIAAGMPKFKL